MLKIYLGILLYGIGLTSMAPRTSILRQSLGEMLEEPARKVLQSKAEKCIVQSGIVGDCILERGPQNIMIIPQCRLRIRYHIFSGLKKLLREAIVIQRDKKLLCIRGGRLYCVIHLGESKVTFNGEDIEFKRSKFFRQIEFNPRQVTKLICWSENVVHTLADTLSNSLGGVSREYSKAEIFELSFIGIADKEGESWYDIGARDLVSGGRGIPSMWRRYSIYNIVKSYMVLPAGTVKKNFPDFADQSLAILPVKKEVEFPLSQYKKVYWGNWFRRYIDRGFIGLWIKDYIYSRVYRGLGGKRIRKRSNIQTSHILMIKTVNSRRKRGKGIIEAIYLGVAGIRGRLGLEVERSFHPLHGIPCRNKSCRIIGVFTNGDRLKRSIFKVLQSEERTDKVNLREKVSSSLECRAYMFIENIRERYLKEGRKEEFIRINIPFGNINTYSSHWDLVNTENRFA